MTPTASQLVELIHRFLPSNVWEDEPGYTRTPEYQRLKAAREEAWESQRGRWKSFLERLQSALPHGKIEEWSILQTDNCWRVRVYLPESVPVVGGGRELHAVVGLVSIFVPVSVTYTSFHQYVAKDQWRPSRTFYEPMDVTREYEQVLTRLLDEELGAPRLSNEVLFTPVPDIQYYGAELGKARLIDCLFTTDRW